MYFAIDLEKVLSYKHDITISVVRQSNPKSTFFEIFCAITYSSTPYWQSIPTLLRYPWLREFEICGFFVQALGCFGEVWALRKQPLIFIKDEQ